MRFEATTLPDVLLILPERHTDSRGYFSEIFRQDLIEDYLGPTTFVQENQSFNLRQGTLRGLHFQVAPHAQDKLVRCATGAIFDVAVDIRKTSSTFGHWIGCELSAEDGSQLFVPKGFAHGFCTLEPNTLVCYRVTDYYRRESDFGIAWNDPDLGIEWPETADPSSLSERDMRLPRLGDTLAEDLTSASDGARDHA